MLHFSSPLPPLTTSSGKYNNDDGKVTELHDNAESGCLPCSTGKKSTELRIECEACPNRLTTQSEGAAECDSCEVSYYMSGDTECFLCPEGSNCDSLGNELATLSIITGYFRAFSDSKEVYMCALEEACRGGNQTGDDLCSQGYEGPLCNRLVCHMNSLSPYSNDHSYLRLKFSNPPPSSHTYSCQDMYYYDSYGAVCSECSVGLQAFIPLIVISSILVLIGIAVACNYRFLTTYFEKDGRKEGMLRVLNQATMLLVTVQLITALGGAHRFRGGSDYVSL